MPTTMMVTPKSRAKFAYFSQCEDELRLTPTADTPNGYTAEECFHAIESWGQRIPCREPKLLDRALNGKEQHGMTVAMLAEDYVERLVFSCEIDKYPAWVANEIYAQAAKVAAERVGFVPTFVSRRADFTTINHE